MTAQQVYLHDIINSPNYDDYDNILINEPVLPKKLPRNVKMLHFGSGFFVSRGIAPNFRQASTHEIRGFIPSTVTHLRFDGVSFSDSMAGVIPNTVSHLTFGNYSHFDICGIIPDGITHLTFEKSLFQDVTCEIPNTVTHLVFNCQYIPYFKGKIPTSVNHLEFQHEFTPLDTKTNPEIFIDLYHLTKICQQLNGKILPTVKTLVVAGMLFDPKLFHNFE